MSSLKGLFFHRKFPSASALGYHYVAPSALVIFLFYPRSSASIRG